ncbi:MAG: crotonobetainyl-CoA:carnitine CoA-transferase CaiB-like acyl-CoA transferase [Candidatus Azotimanducaceae bacterium]
MGHILAGLKVIDAASYVAGPAATTVMADFGADVIKVEPPSGDGYRSLAARYRTDYNWQLTSRHKRALALDLKSAKGQAVLLSLVDQADVLVVNFNAKQLAEYQLDYAALKQRNPRLIFAQITGYGTRGPDRSKRAFDLSAWWARSGIMDMMKPLGGAPVNGVGGVGDHASAMSLFGVVMLALYDRERSGQGASVSTSLVANGAWSNGMHLQGMIAGYDLAAVLDKHGYRSPFVMSYKTRDERYVVLVGPNPQREWPRLCRAMGHPEWLQEPRFAEMTGVMALRDEVRELFARALSRFRLDEVVLRLEAEDVTFSVLEKNSDVIHDAHLIENEVIVKTASEHPDYQWTVASPINIVGQVKKIPTDAPAVGAHSRDILCELGYTAGQIDELIAHGIVKCS